VDSSDLKGKLNGKVFGTDLSAVAATIYSVAYPACRRYGMLHARFMLKVCTPNLARMHNYEFIHFYLLLSDCQVTDVTLQSVIACLEPRRKMVCCLVIRSYVILFSVKLVD